jgi:hypothetical protein
MILRTDVATFFEDDILAIREAVQEQKDTALVPVTVCIFWFSTLFHVR